MLSFLSRATSTRLPLEGLRMFLQSVVRPARELVGLLSIATLMVGVALRLADGNEHPALVLKFLQDRNAALAERTCRGMPTSMAVTRMARATTRTRLTKKNARLFRRYANFDATQHRNVTPTQRR